MSLAFLMGFMHTGVWINGYGVLVSTRLQVLLWQRFIAQNMCYFEPREQRTNDQRPEDLYRSTVVLQCGLGY